MTTAKTVRRIDGLQAQTAIAVLNQLRLDMLKLKAGTVFHAEASPADVSPAAADLPTSIAMANALKAELNTHMAFACDATTGQGAHLAADATNPVVAANAVDLGTLETLLNAIKTAFNAHLTQAGVHATNDATNTCSTTNASDLPTSETLANALQTKVNAHFAAAFTSVATNLVAP